MLYIRTGSTDPIPHNSLYAYQSIYLLKNSVRLHPSKAPYLRDSHEQGGTSYHEVRADDDVHVRVLAAWK